MTDYLEEGPGQGEALLQALEAMVLWIPVPDGRTAEADGGTSLPATDLCIQGSFVSPADRREPEREDAPGFFHRGGGPAHQRGKGGWGGSPPAALRPPGAGTGSGGPE